MENSDLGPTINTLKAEVDFLDGEVKKLLNLLADARTESMKLRAALGDILSYVPHGNLPLNLYDKARAALEGK